MQLYSIFCCSEKNKLIIEESYHVNHRKLGINCSGCHWLAALGHLVSKHFITKAFEFFCVLVLLPQRQHTSWIRCQDQWSAMGSGGRAPAICGGVRRILDCGQINRRLKCNRRIFHEKLHITSGSRSPRICAHKPNHCNISLDVHVCGFRCGSLR